MPTLSSSDASLGRTLSPSAPHIAAEVVQAARREGATTLDDVFSRRFRLSLRAKDAGLPVALDAALLLAAETGRDAAWAAAQVEAYADAVLGEDRIDGYNREAFLERLRGEQPVERVAMVEREPGNTRRVSQSHRKRLELIGGHLLGDEPIDVTREQPCMRDHVVTPGGTLQLTAQP